jgi:hypothetical protein
VYDKPKVQQIFASAYLSHAHIGGATHVYASCVLFYNKRCYPLNFFSIVGLNLFYPEFVASETGRTLSSCVSIGFLCHWVCVSLKGKKIEYTFVMNTFKKIKIWVHDYLYMVHGAMSTLVYVKPPEHYRGYVVGGKVPVVIIPGILGKWSFMKKIADTISHLGHPVYVVPNLGYNLYSVPESSAMVNEVIKKENLTNVILVAHSKGGLIGKHVLIHHNSSNAILGMVSVATPYSGSSMAKLLPYDPVRELLKDNSTIRDLQSHEQVNSKIVSICPLYDNHVWAEEGSHLKGAKNIDVDVHGHHKIVYDKEVIRNIVVSIEEITQAKFHNTEMQN